ncbi:MAG: ABC transporter ATP-binding protein [Planctomycetia bacterium]|nr:ABC transporter ATP-binding protein [Planctomycetia bacterium]
MKLANPTTRILNKSIQAQPAEVLMIDQTAIRAHQLGKCYHRYTRQWDRIRQWFRGGRRKYYSEHWALQPLNLHIPRGQTTGILGANGSGKSTLLQLIAGTLNPSTGSLAVHGRVAALLELGSGFHPEFSGWENVRLQASILGLSEEEILDKSEQIARFSELAEALDRPLRTYSSGMILRLGFSIAISIDPDILLVDEALAVGDLHFQQKCMRRIQQLREQGVTILLVTHDLGTTKRLCETVHVLDQGRLVQSGPAEPVCNWYVAHLLADRGQKEALPIPTSGSIYRHGNRQAEILSWHWSDSNKFSCPEKTTRHQQLWLDSEQTLCVKVKFHQSMRKPVLGFYLRDQFGTELMGENTYNAGISLTGTAGNETTIEFRFGLHLRPGTYTLCLGLVDDPAQPVCLDWIDQAMFLHVHDPKPGRVIHGLFAEPVSVRTLAS